MHAASPELHENLLSSMTGLISRWSSLELQRRITAECGITLDPVAVAALYTLGLSGGTSRPSALADTLHLSRPSTSKLIARMHEAVLLTRTSAPGDGRAVTGTLTPLGRQVCRWLVDAGVSMVADATRTWHPDEVSTLSRLMERFLADLDADFAEKRLPNSTSEAL